MKKENEKVQTTFLGDDNFPSFREGRLELQGCGLGGGGVDCKISGRDVPGQGAKGAILEKIEVFVEKRKWRIFIT